MKIYLDVIWLLNFCFDSLLLLLTAFILKRQVKKRRVAAGGFIGSAIVLPDVYACFSLCGASGGKNGVFSSHRAYGFWL